MNKQDYFLNKGDDYINNDGDRITCLQLCKESDNKAVINAMYENGRFTRIDRCGWIDEDFHKEVYTPLAKQYFKDHQTPPNHMVVEVRFWKDANDIYEKYKQKQDA